MLRTKLRITVRAASAYKFFAISPALIAKIIVNSYMVYDLQVIYSISLHFFTRFLCMTVFNFTKTQFAYSFIDINVIGKILFPNLKS